MMVLDIFWVSFRSKKQNYTLSSSQQAVKACMLANQGRIGKVMSASTPVLGLTSFETNLEPIVHVRCGGAQYTRRVASNPY